MPIDQLELLLEDPAMREALTVVLDRSDGGSEEVEWGDVKDVLSSGQWGQLIEREVLVSTGAGFTVAKPDRVRRVLKEQQTQPPTETIEPEKWSSIDKAAGVFALVLFAGYWSSTLRDVIASAENIVLGPITDLIPFYGVIIVLAVITGLYSTVLQARLTDREKLSKYQQRMKKIRERKQAAKERGDEEELEKIQQEQMAAAGEQLNMFKLQFRPMVWIMLLTIPVFLWLRWQVIGGHLDETGMVLPIAGAVSWQQSLVGPMQTWIVWYFLCSMASRQIIQKTLNIQRSPSQ